MNIYQLTNSDPNKEVYDTFDGCIVQADTEEEARRIHPNGCLYDDFLQQWSKASYKTDCMDWCKLEFITVELLGTSTNNLGKGVILASYNAG